MNAPDVNYVRNCTLHRVIDGDTVELLVDLGFKRYSREIVRFAGLNAPEMFGEQKIAGDQSRAFTEFWFTGSPNAQFILDSHKKDSFGRWLGTIWKFEGDTAHSLSADLLELSLAEVWPAPEK